MLEDGMLEDGMLEDGMPEDGGMAIIGAMVVFKGVVAVFGATPGYGCKAQKHT